MKVFASIVEAGSFSRAAEQLHVSNTAASRHLAELEQYLGVRLLQRSTRRLSLTEAGANYYERCRHILADVEDAEATAGSAEGQVRGSLRISLPHSFGLQYVAPLIPEFCRRHPQLHLELNFSDRLTDLVEEGVDLALRIALEINTSLVARKLTDIHIVCCASPEYLARAGEPAAPEELTRHACLTYAYAEKGDTWRFQSAAGEHAVSVKGEFRANNGEMIRLAGLAGQGIMLQPTFLVGDDLRAGRLVRVLPSYDVAARAAYAVYLPAARRSARVRAMVDFLSEAFGQGEPPWDRELFQSAQKT
ncbi:MAG: LysR family transcriptional regulator [Rhodocyclaceae bacterium]|nr:LysR family transcriptional regulator [Rhodocyclaceae bacterium]